jgi:hypothetical protein
MPDLKTFYPGGAAGNPINNSTDSVNAATATVGNSVDDQNSANNSLVWTGTALEYAAVNPKDANTLYFVV